MEYTSSPPTASRRRRAEMEEDEGSTFDEGESQASKRQRLSDVDGEDEEQQEEEVQEETLEGDVLPESYRRSPRKQEHKPGSIVRIAMKNFVTYTDATFHPGPNLNMIIGPNGTGKSTLVCGICLGLGWKPEHLGRAKDISEFVKHGSKEALIEIELKADPAQHQTNPIIQCKISREGGGKNNQDKKTAFKIDGRSVSNKTVQEFVRKLYIQVDNLCQFLPQDRVVEFAALSPVELLVQTQRAAAAPEMSAYHEDLKKWRKEEKKLQDDQQNLIDDLKRLEDRQRAQAGDVDRMREREVVKERLALLKKYRPFTVFNELKRTHDELKKRAKKAAKELERLNRQIEPNLQAVNAKQAYHDQIQRVVESKRRMVQRSVEAVANHQKKFKDAEQAVADCDKEIKAETDNAAKAKSEVSKLQQANRTIENAMANPPAEFNPAAMNEKTNELGRRVRTLKEEQSLNVDAMNGLREQAAQRQQIITEEQEKQTHLQSQAGMLESKLLNASKATCEVWRWLQAKDNQAKFQERVYGPPMVECSVQGSQNADWVESMVGMGELKAFTVTNQQDFNTLTRQAYQVMGLTDVNVRFTTTDLASYTKPELSPEQMRSMGLDGWLMELIEGPEPVLAMLCDNRNIHKMAYCRRDTTPDQFDLIKRSPVNAWITPVNVYQITRRSEYGDAGVVTRVTAIKRSRYLTDAPVSTQAEDDSNAKINDYRADLAHIKEEMEGVKARHGQIRDEIKRLDGEIETIKNDKAKLQQAKSAFDGLGTKLTNNETRLADYRAQLAEQGARKWAISQRQMKLLLEQGQHALDQGKAVQNLQRYQEDLLRVEINRIEAASDLAQLTARNQADLDQQKAKEEEVRTMQADRDAAKERGREQQEKCQELAAGMVDMTPVEEETHEEIQLWEPPQIDTEIASVEASLDLLAGHGNANLIRDFEDRAKKIDEKRARRYTVEEDLEALTSKIAEMRNKWEPELDHLISQISDAFAENFSRIQCAGEVGIDKQEDFADWAIQIKVKFRENEQLQVLDSHRQSGGERAVSTIFYLMALQSMARAPFRVVDEINQGMDPRNERLVHSRMVDIACAEHTSQYFLITPKLLNNLKYHPNMKVHCIASGEYMPDKNDQLDTFEAMAQVALRVKNGIVA
ncbi:Putative structural maintenance of chromosomes protein [Septoria linicola]|uniref:Structural maintenance of chromosomes protein 5 n=1 Tax=Septoria linicola TaxID=215465 RepID=A0A9Q9AK72_9PEZI|nr:Putative structural maintenance of chromosomes protein [Septoria linicola]